MSVWLENLSVKDNDGAIRIIIALNCFKCIIKYFNKFVHARSKNYARKSFSTFLGSKNFFVNVSRIYFSNSSSTLREIYLGISFDECFITECC